MVCGRIPVIASCLLAVWGGGCATVRVSIYEAEEIDSVIFWHITFAEEPGRYEKTIGTHQGQTTTVVKEGYPPVDLQLRDDIYFRVRDHRRIDVVRGIDDADGLILLRPLHFTRGGYKSLDMLLADEDHGAFARIRINNGNRSPIIKNNEKFANFCGDALIKVLTNPYLH